jgi:transcription antitermination factor NusA-like protein
MEGSSIPFEVKELVRRVDGFHERIGRVEGKQSNHTTDIAILKRDGEEIRTDIAEIKKVVEDEGRRNRASNNRVIGAMIGLAVSAVGSAIAFALASGGHP